MIKLFLFCFFLLPVSTGFSQTGSATIFLKNKQMVSCQVREVRPNGLLTGEDLLIYFKVVDSLQTPDRLLADRISLTIEGGKTSVHPTFVSIDLRSCTFPVILPSDSSRIQNTLFYGILSSAPVTLVGLRLDFQTNYLLPVWLRVDLSVGNADNRDKFLNAYSGAAAIGYKYPVAFQPQLFVGMGAYSSASSLLPEPDKVQFLPFLQTGIEYEPFPGYGLVLSAGSTLYPIPLRHYYFSAADQVSKKETFLSFNFGIGINLNRF